MMPFKSKFDKLDFTILQQVQEDSTLSIQELAETVGLSNTACWRRLRRLHEQGLIHKEVALLDSHRLDLSVNVFANVRLKVHSQESLQQFEESVARIPEIVECYSVTGDTDFLLRIVVKDVAAYEELLYKKLIRLFEVTNYKSMFSLRQVKYSTKLPITQENFLKIDW